MFVTKEKSIDLSNVDKQFVLVGTDGRMLAKHTIVLTEVVTKFNISADFQ